MEIEESKANGAIILILKGRMDASNSQALEEKALTLIEAGERRIVFDLGELEYVGSAGLRVFLVAAKRLSSMNGKMSLASPQRLVKEVLDISGFSSVLQICATREEAVAAMQS